MDFTGEMIMGSGPREHRIDSVDFRSTSNAELGQGAEAFEKQVLDACLEATDSSCGMIGMINEHGKYDTTTYRTRTVKDCVLPDALALHLSRRMAKRGIRRWSMLHREALLCNDLELHHERVGQPEGHAPIHCFLGVPLKSEGKVVGTVAVANKPGGYSEEDLKTLSRLAGFIEVSRKHREELEEAKRTSAELEKVVTNRTAELADTNKRLMKEIVDREKAEEEKEKLQSLLQRAQMMEMIGTLASGMAHNFNNLLASILGNAELGILESDEISPNLERLQDIKKAVRSGARLTGRLLGFARGGRDEVKPISLNRLVKEISETFGQVRKNVTFYLELAEDLCGIEADQGQIEQLLLNIFVNAADAMPSGGDLFLKTMNIAEKDMRNKASEVKEGDYVLLSARDTGMGMDEATMAHIFDPFFTTKALSGHTGIGLASAYDIVKGHGGTIRVDSEKGVGTTFSIYLPATASEAVVAEEALSTELMKGHETILLVDDEPMVLHSIEGMLNRLGYTVFLAVSGREALDLYKEHQDVIDMVLLDMVMPGYAGGEVYDRMKEINPKVKVLLSSGYDIGGGAEAILKRGCDGFIQKPFSLQEVSHGIRTVLEKDM
jgi:signal transduction histidine kinase/ActR/RegA family two-component response regulator